MSHKSGRSKNFKTPEARFMYVKHMFYRDTKKNDDGTPKKDASGKEITQQSVTLIFNKAITPISTFEACVMEAIRDSSWGESGLTMLQQGLIRLPFLDGAGKEARRKNDGSLKPGMGPDVWFLRVATQLEAPVRYLDPNIPAVYDEGKGAAHPGGVIKSGDYGFAVLTCFTWYNAKNGNGISFGINMLQKKRDGDALITGGGVDVDEFFEAVSPAASAGLGAANMGGMFAGGAQPQTAAAGGLNGIFR